MQELEKILEEMREASVFAKNYDGSVAECVTIGAAERILRKHTKNDGWIPAEERLPEEKINPVSMDFYEYQVTAKFGNTKDVRHYKYGKGHWWHGAGIVDKYVVAWKENPEPYKLERRDNHDGK